MKSQASSAIENGLTRPVDEQGYADAAHVLRDLAAVQPKSIFSSIGMIITQISRPTGRLTCATLHLRRRAWKAPGSALAEHNAAEDAQKHPDGQVTFKQAHVIAASC